MSITTRTVYVGRCDECGALMSDEGYECQWPTEEDARATVEECADDMAWGSAEGKHFCPSCASLHCWACHRCLRWQANRIHAALRDNELLCPECVEAEE